MRLYLKQLPAIQAIRRPAVLAAATRKTVSPAAVVIAGFLMVLLPALIPTFYVTLLTRMMYFGILASSLNLLVGHLGLVSFGHAGLYAAGAYGLAILLDDTSLPFWLAFMGGAAIAAAVAALMAVFVVRVRGQIYFALLTLAFAQLIFVLAEQLIDFTGGSNGLLIARRMPHILSEPRNQYYLAFASLGLTTAAIWAVVHSPFGAVAHAIREDPPRAAGLGINVALVRVWMFTISGLFAGLAGMAAAVTTGGAFPEFAFWLTSGEGLVMVILRGIGYLLGPLIGAAALVGLEHVTVRYLGNWPLYLGIVLILTVLLFPYGLVGSLLAARQVLGRQLWLLRQAFGRGARLGGQPGEARDGEPR